jgi:hypothetical protein
VEVSLEIVMLQTRIQAAHLLLGWQPMLRGCFRPEEAEDVVSTDNATTIYYDSSIGHGGR